MPSRLSKPLVLPERFRIIWDRRTSADNIRFRSQNLAKCRKNDESIVLDIALKSTPDYSYYAYKYDLSVAELERVFDKKLCIIASVTVKPAEN